MNRLFSCLAAAAALAGSCRTDPDVRKTYPVTGTVSINGTPAEAGLQVALVPQFTETDKYPIHPRATTGADGTYNFGTLAAGTYSILVEQPPNTLAGQSAAGSFGGSPVINGILDIPVPAGQTSVGYDVGFIERLR